MRHALAAVALAVAAAGCSSGGGANPTPAASASPTPLVSRPLPSAAPALGAELALVADALERAGDGARERHDRLQACIRLARLREHLTGAGKRLAPAAQVREIRRADRLCPTDQPGAARAVRAVAASASATP